MVLEEEEAEEEEECEEGLCSGVRRVRQLLMEARVDPARQRYCWWLASADGSQVGHAICRRGSSGVNQGDLLGTTVDTWSASVLEAYAVFFSFLREGELGS